MTVSGLISILDRYGGPAWRVHYHVPRLAYALAVPLGGGIAIVGALSRLSWLLVVGLGVAFASLVGLARWALDQRRCAGGLVVPRFRASSGQRAREIQSMVIAGLKDHLTAEEADRVHSIPATIGPSDRRLAAAISRGFVLSTCSTARYARVPETV